MLFLKTNLLFIDIIFSGSLLFEQNFSSFVKFQRIVVELGSSIQIEKVGLRMNY